jgi:hypothetical protein
MAALTLLKWQLLKSGQNIGQRPWPFHRGDTSVCYASAQSINQSINQSMYRNEIVLTKVA